MIPHDSWATVYDEVYSRTFGDLLDRLTKATLEIVSQHETIPSKLLDIGAGTGRLAIPLAQNGYQVCAVDASLAMTEVLRLNAKKQSCSLAIYHKIMQDLSCLGPFDFAMCVFTVLIYLLDQDSLDRSMKSVANVLQPGGCLLFDVPNHGLFNSYEILSNDFNRTVTIRSSGPDLFEYQESIDLRIKGQMQHFDDQFSIKYWQTEKVIQSAKKSGFIEFQNLSEFFPQCGSQYFLARKKS